MDSVGFHFCGVPGLVRLMDMESGQWSQEGRDGVSVSWRQRVDGGHRAGGGMGSVSQGNRVSIWDDERWRRLHNSVNVHSAPELWT